LLLAHWHSLRPERLAVSAGGRRRRAVGGYLPQAYISQIESLHVEVLRDGKLVYELPMIDALRQNRINDLERLDTGVRRLLTPHIYHVSLSKALWDLKQELIRSTMI
jgi:hypothetical protein